MKEGWVEKKFGDSILFEIIDGDRGKNYPKQSDFFPEGYCLFLNTKNVRPDGFNFDTTMFVDKNKDAELRKGKLKRRDVILTTRGTIGNVAIYDDNVEFENIRINSGMLIFRPNEYLITSEYLFKILLSPVVRQQISESTSGAAQPQLPIKTLVNFIIPIPPLPEQKQIVAILDEAFEGIDRTIANTEKNLTNARELFESYLKFIFTNRSDEHIEKKLGEVSSFSQGIQVEVKLQSETVKNGKNVRFLRIVDFTQGNIIPRYIENPGDKYVVNKKDIALVRYGASTGFVCRGLSGAIANNLFKVTPLKNTLSNDYLYYFLCSPAFQDSIKNVIGGAAMPAISFGLIKNIKVVFPRISRQGEIVEILNFLKLETQHLEAIHQQKLVALNELKQSILQKAFTGELTADIVYQTIEATEENHRISQDGLPSAKTIKQNVHQSEQLSLWT